jgi:hypothetical protein
MEHLADIKQGIAGQWVNESAQFTMQALREYLIDLVNRLSNALERTWTGAGAQGELAAPVQKWLAGPEPAIDFAGYAPSAGYARLSAMHLNPATARRVALAEQLRQFRLQRAAGASPSEC